MLSIGSVLFIVVTAIILLAIDKSTGRIKFGEEKYIGRTIALIISVICTGITMNALVFSRELVDLTNSGLSYLNLMAKDGTPENPKKFDILCSHILKGITVILGNAAVPPYDVPLDFSRSGNFITLLSDSFLPLGSEIL